MARLSNLDEPPARPVGPRTPPSPWPWRFSALGGAGATIAEIVYSGFVHPLPAVLIGMSAFGFTLLAGLLYHRHQRLLAWADAESLGDGLPIGPGGER